MSSISVALVTRNRPESLRRTLLSLSDQSRQPEEVVVSDDSDDSWADLTRGVCTELGVRYVAGPRRGLYANRNHVSRACRGTHLRTMDDDHTFPPGHWEAVEEAVAKDPEAVWVIGEATPAALGTGAEWVCPPQLHPRGYSTTPRPGALCWSLADGATVYPKAAFAAAGGYYEGFVFGASYLELGSRLHWRGRRIRHLGSTYVVHHADERPRSFEDPYEDLASRIFASMCHSFVYQPSVANRMMTSAQIVLESTRGGKLGRRAVRRGIRAFREHRLRLPDRGGVG